MAKKAGASKQASGHRSLPIRAVITQATGVSDMIRVLLAYYSSTGNTGKLAKEIARVLSDGGNTVDIERIVPSREYGVLERYVFGALGAMCRARRPITKPSRDASKYDLLVIGSPVWAGNPAPPVNAYIDLLPVSGRAFVFVSSGGPRNRGALDAMADSLKAKGFEIAGKFGMRKGANFDEGGELKAALKKAI